MPVAQAQVLQYGVERQLGLGGVCAVVLGQVAAKGGFIQVGAGGACHGHHIGIDQAAALEHALHFFARGHMAFVGALLDPNAALVVRAFAVPLGTVTTITSPARVGTFSVLG